MRTDLKVVCASIKIPNPLSGVMVAPVKVNRHGIIPGCTQFLKNVEVKRGNRNSP